MVIAKVISNDMPPLIYTITLLGINNETILNAQTIVWI